MAEQNGNAIASVSTGCRGVELRLARKVDFDRGRVWVIPKENSKTRKRFVRGLSELSVECLAELFEVIEAIL